MDRDQLVQYCDQRLHRALQLGTYHTSRQVGENTSTTQQLFCLVSQITHRSDRSNGQTDVCIRTNKAKHSQLCLICYSFGFLSFQVIKTTTLIKLSTILAVCGLGTVLTTLLLNALGMLTVENRTLCLVVGFTAMLLGTLWKVVLEMNRED